MLIFINKTISFIIMYEILVTILVKFKKFYFNGVRVYRAVVASGTIGKTAGSLVTPCCDQK